VDDACTPADVDVLLSSIEVELFPTSLEVGVLPAFEVGVLPPFEVEVFPRGWVVSVFGPLVA
jgi:hypothetical protein